MKALTFVRTSMSCMLISFTLFACNNETSLSQSVSKEPEQSRVEQALSEAISNQDYRLYGLAGRRVVLPGLENENFDTIKKRCGVKLLSASSDVLKNNQDRKKRRLNYQFALTVNEYIYALCLKNTTKKV